MEFDCIHSRFSYYTSPDTQSAFHFVQRFIMSKKNNKKTRAKQHAFDLSREKAAGMKKKVEAEKTQKRLAAKAPGFKTKKKVGIRVRKGVTIQVSKLGSKPGSRMPQWIPSQFQINSI